MEIIWTRASVRLAVFQPLETVKALTEERI